MGGYMDEIVYRSAIKVVNINKISESSDLFKKVGIAMMNDIFENGVIDSMNGKHVQILFCVVDDLKTKLLEYKKPD